MENCLKLGVDFLLRSLREDEDVTSCISPKDSESNSSLLDYVKNGSSEGELGVSPFFATTKSLLEVLTNFAKRDDDRVAIINAKMFIDAVEGVEVFDLSNKENALSILNECDSKAEFASDETRATYVEMAARFASAKKEVDFKGTIPSKFYVVTTAGELREMYDFIYEKFLSDYRDPRVLSKRTLEQLKNKAAAATVQSFWAELYSFGV